MNKIKKLSVVIPVYNCIDTLEELFNRLENNLKNIVKDYEIIFVDDSNDFKSWEILNLISKKSNKTLCIKLSRNFGQHAAIMAGLNNSTGDWIIIMDCDLQDRPEEIKNLIKACDVKTDIIFASRKKRSDNLIKKLSSKFFYFLIEFLCEIKMDHTVSNFGLYSRKVIEAVLSINDNHKFFPLMVRWTGFQSKTIDIKHDERTKGKSSYNLKKSLLISISAIVSFSNKPLRIFIYFGFLISLISIIVAFYFLYLALNDKITVIGWASVILSIWFFGGMFLSSVGIVGFYIGKTFDQTKKRPSYIISKKLNFD